MWSLVINILREWLSHVLSTLLEEEQQRSTIIKVALTFHFDPIAEVKILQPPLNKLSGCYT